MKSWSALDFDGLVGKNYLGKLHDLLQERGLLSELRFADVLVSTRRSRFGGARITHDAAKGVAEELVGAQAVKLQETELLAAKNGVSKKICPSAAQRGGAVKQLQFMQGRRFTAFWKANRKNIDLIKKHYDI